VIPSDAILLTLYINASDRGRGRPLHEEIVATARAMGLAGASVFPADLGYGVHRRLRDARSEYASFDLPVMIEIVDVPVRIEALRTELGMIIREGLAILSPVRLLPDGQAAEPPRDWREGLRPEEAPHEPALVPRPESERSMTLERDVQRLIVYVGSSDTWHGRNLAIAIVERCRELGLAGATASQGVVGFGKHSRIHRAHLLGLSEDLPERIEIVDQPEKIAAIVHELEAMIDGGLMVVEDVRAVRYLRDPKKTRQTGSQGAS
jgi:PII-like signaling protein